ncbi:MULTISPECIES: NAD-dependent epimerase/dehydratase family protein [unclassified Curtobacterium]|uniref:NAD-dependent epimerase/dehydratase family protein n=1 Tax=unclassified Curtobacterium TaxID=257496 RepID=UPI00381B819C
MRALVLGGTGWLGRAIVRDLLDAGTDVTCLARGTSGDVPAGARLVRADRRAADAHDLVRGDWDEVVELSSDPGLVDPALDALADTAAHWTLVSSVSVYARNDEPDADETAALVEPVDPTAYADAKVRAEQRTAARLGPRVAIGRPGLVVGAGDPSDRFGYWAARLDRSGPALAPMTAGRFAQVVDVADLAAWIGDAGRGGYAGTVNAVGEPIPMSDLLRHVAAVTGHDDGLVEVGDDELLALDVRYWAGPRSLPLWLPASDTAFAQRSARRYRASGGRTRPLRDTIADVLTDERSRGRDRPRRAGLTASEEAVVLRSVR